MNEILVAMFAKRDPTTVYYGAGFKFATKIIVFAFYGFLLPFVLGRKWAGMEEGNFSFQRIGQVYELALRHNIRCSTQLNFRKVRKEPLSDTWRILYGLCRKMQDKSAALTVYHRFYCTTMNLLRP